MSLEAGVAEVFRKLDLQRGQGRRGFRRNAEEARQSGEQPPEPGGTVPATATLVIGFMVYGLISATLGGEEMNDP